MGAHEIFDLDHRAFWQAFSLPVPAKEYRFWPGRAFRFDFAWVKEKIALEIEGGIWTQGRHSRGAGMRSDMEKYNMATAMGWRIFRFTPKDMADCVPHAFLQRVFSLKNSPDNTAEQ